MESIRNILKDLTLEDLREWAGEKIYQRGKDYTACVSQLSRTEGGTLVAWVSGTDEYATWVRHEGQGDFAFACACPYDWGPCKHAVALLLAAAGQLKQRKEIPLLDPEGDLYLEAFEGNDDDWQDDEADIVPRPSSVRLIKNHSPDLEQLLADKSRHELQALLMDLAGEFPEVSRKLREKGQLEAGKVDQLVRSLRKELRKLTSQEAWYSHWEHRGNLPDYSHLQKQLQALLNNGNADAVLELGEELWTRGIEQVELSNDEGMTAAAISACLAIVLLALPQTALSPAEQLLWLAERELEDQYDLLGDTGKVLNDWRYTPLHWREVAAAIEKKLKQMAVPQSARFSERYQRERVMLWLRDAYLRSKEPHKVIPLLEQEAARCQCYEPLVKALLDAGESERARQWCIRGFKQTLKDAPGIASGLQRQLRKLAEAEGQFKLAAAYRAEDFFERPSEDAYLDLREAAEKAAVWSDVRLGVLDYLQRGERPVGSGGEISWPLPEPEVKETKSKDAYRLTSFPNRDMLIAIAILEKRLDDAVGIHRERTETMRWNGNVDEALAKAVAASHPDVALQIWQSIAESLIGQVKPKAYQQAARYLRKMHKVYEQTDRLADWQALIMNLRTRHKAKRRLMEVLDGLGKIRKLVG
jgi:uncharacterized Zn finger protein